MIEVSGCGFVGWSWEVKESVVSPRGWQRRELRGARRRSFDSGLGNAGRSKILEGYLHVITIRLWSDLTLTLLLNATQRLAVNQEVDVRAFLSESPEVHLTESHHQHHHNIVRMVGHGPRGLLVQVEFGFNAHILTVLSTD